MRACVWLEVRTTTSAAQLFRSNTQALRCIAAILHPILTPWFKTLFSETLAVINISPEVGAAFSAIALLAHAANCPRSIWCFFLFFFCEKKR